MHYNGGFFKSQTKSITPTGTRTAVSTLRFMDGSADEKPKRKKSTAKIGIEKIAPVIVVIANFKRRAAMEGISVPNMASETAHPAQYEAAIMPREEAFIFFHNSSLLLSLKS